MPRGAPLGAPRGILPVSVCFFADARFTCVSFGDNRASPTPQWDPSAGHSARPCALLRGSVSPFPRARGSPAPQRRKKEGKSLPFFRGGDNRAPPIPPRGPLGGAFRATLRPAPRLRLTFPAGARFTSASFGDNRAPPTPQGGPLGGAFRATLRPAPRSRLIFPAGARFACASTTKKGRQQPSLFLWWGQQGSNL